MSLATLILSIVFVINLSLLLFILTNPNKQRRWPIFFMILMILLWQFTELLNITVFVKHDILLLFGVRGGLLPTLYLAPAFLWLVFSLFDRWKSIVLWKKILIWLPALAMSPFVFSEYNLTKPAIVDGQVFYSAGPIYWYFAIYFASLMGYGLYQLIRNRKDVDLIIKRQIDYIFVGTALAATGGLIFSILMPVLGDNSLYYLGSDSTILFTTIVTYALFRYEFFDLRASLHRVVIDMLRLLITGAIYNLLYLVLQRAVEIDFSNLVNITYFVIFIALTAPLVFRIVNRAVNSILINPAEEVKSAEDKVAEVLRSSRDLDILFSRLSRQISQVIDFKDIFIYLAKRSKPGVFYQTFPVGERMISTKDSLLLKHLEKKRIIVNEAEIEYLKLDRFLSKELKEKQIDVALPIYYNQQLLGVITMDNDKKLLSIQQINFLKQVNKYLDIAIGSLLLYQQDLMENKKD